MQCSKCGKETGNSRHAFLYRWERAEYSSRGKTTIRTTQSGTGKDSCLLCDDCIAAYVRKVKEGRPGLFKLLCPCVMSAIIGLMLILLAEKELWKLIGAALIVVIWTVAIKNFIGEAKKLKERAERIAQQSDALNVRALESEACAKFLSKKLGSETLQEIPLSMLDQ